LYKKQITRRADRPNPALSPIFVASATIGDCAMTADGAASRFGRYFNLSFSQRQAVQR
jgi:hypothetical protein